MSYKHRGDEIPNYDEVPKPKAYLDGFTEIKFLLNVTTLTPLEKQQLAHFLLNGIRDNIPDELERILDNWKIELDRQEQVLEAQTNASRLRGRSRAKLPITNPLPPKP